MTRPEAQLDGAITAISQAWIGGIQAWGQVFERFWGSMQEGAHKEVDVVGDNQAELLVTGAGGPISITPLVAGNVPSTIGPESIQLSRAAIRANVPTRIVVTVFPDPSNAEVTHVGDLLDANGTAVARVRVPVSPPSA